MRRNTRTVVHAHLRTITAITTACAAILTYQHANAAAITALINAEISDDTTAIVNNTQSVSLTPPDDFALQTAGTDLGGPIVALASTAANSLSSNALGAAGALFAISSPGADAPRHANAGAQVDYDDQLQVLSPSLADGTPVQITFSFAAQHATVLLHTLAEPGNNTHATYEFSATIANASSDDQTINIAPADHRFQQDAGSFFPSTMTGIMDPGSPELDLVFDSFVGDTIQLQFTTLADLQGSIESTGAGLINTQSTTALAALGIAFGATPITPDVTLQSTLLDASFPAASLATADAAANAATLPDTPTIPTPTTAALTLTLLSLLAATHRPHNKPLNQPAYK